MKILCLSDLHRTNTISLAIQKQNAWIAELLDKYKPDVVVVTGDVFEGNYSKNPYEELHHLFKGITTICTLGNHEFWFNTVGDVLENYKECYAPEKWDVHYLDIVGHHDIGNVHFFGNVLWYDGSTASITNQDVSDFAGRRWRDYEISNFNPLEESRKCIDQIIQNQPAEEQVGILCTHGVPDKTLNGHYRDGIKNEFDAFSGVDKLLEKVRCDYSISGHTHKMVIGKIINGVNCVNTGNDYFPPFKHYLLDV